MKVNMTLISDDEETLHDVNKADEDTEDVSSADVNESDESNKHSKLKVFVLVIFMIFGFILFVWNMVRIVNNMRLDNQGYPVNIVYEMEDLSNFMDSSDGSASMSVDAYQIKDDISKDAARDGPASYSDVSHDKYIDDSDDVAELKKTAQDALNEAALIRQELKNAEDMLDSSLQREAELKSQLDELTKGN